MEEFFGSNVPDTPTPINSAGTPTQKYRNAAGIFDFENKWGSRKVKSRKDLDQPQGKKSPLATGGGENDDAMKRYFGDFSIEAKRNVMDLLKNHPMFDQKGPVKMGRVENNTRKVMPNDSTKTVENGGYLIRQNEPQASQPKY
jgi:hypothetical protein